AADARHRPGADERAAAAAARRTVSRPRADGGQRDPPGPGKAAPERADAVDGGAEARHRARLREPRLRADQGPRGARGQHRQPGAPSGPDRSVLRAGYFLTCMRSIQTLKPTSRSVRNLRVASSVTRPCGSTFEATEPTNTSGRGSTCAQSWPRMRRRSYCTRAPPIGPPEA